MKENTPLQDMVEHLKKRISQLNDADAQFCKDRWDMTKPSFERAIYREESNKATFARQELQLQLKIAESLLEKERQAIVDAYVEGCNDTYGIDEPNESYPDEESGKNYFTRKYNTND